LVRGVEGCVGGFGGGLFECFCGGDGWKKRGCLGGPVEGAEFLVFFIKKWMDGGGLEVSVVQVFASAFFLDLFPSLFSALRPGGCFRVVGVFGGCFCFGFLFWFWWWFLFWWWLFLGCWFRFFLLGFLFFFWWCVDVEGVGLLFYSVG